MKCHDITELVMKASLNTTQTKTCVIVVPFGICAHPVSLLATQSWNISRQFSQTVCVYVEQILMHVKNTRLDLVYLDPGSFQAGVPSPYYCVILSQDVGKQTRFILIVFYFQVAIQIIPQKGYQVCAWNQQHCQ